MKLFLSYASERTAEAEAIYHYLSGLGLDVWFDRQRLILGQDWKREIHLAQQSAELMVLVISNEISHKTGVIQKEVRDALALWQTRPPGSLFILPIKVGNSTVPPELTGIQYVEFSGNWERALARAVALKYQSLSQTVPKSVDDATKQMEGSPENKITLEESYISGYLYWPTMVGSGLYFDYINSLIKARVLGMGHDIKRSAYLCDVEHSSDLRSTFTKSSVEVSVTKHFDDGDCISMRLTCGSYIAGAAHGYVELEGMNFLGPDLNYVNINHLLAYTENNVQKLRQMLIERLLQEQPLLNREEIACSLAGNGLLKNTYMYPPELSNFVLDPTQITFIFNPYVAASYASGTLFASLAWQDIIPLLQHDITRSSFFKRYLLRP